MWSARHPPVHLRNRIGETHELPFKGLEPLDQPLHPLDLHVWDQATAQIQHLPMMMFCRSP